MAWDRTRLPPPFPSSISLLGFPHACVTLHQSYSYTSPLLPLLTFDDFAIFNFLPIVVFKLFRSFKLFSITLSPYGTRLRVTLGSPSPSTRFYPLFIPFIRFTLPTVLRTPFRTCILHTCLHCALTAVPRSSPFLPIFIFNPFSSLCIFCLFTTTLLRFLSRSYAPYTLLKHLRKLIYRQ